MSDGDQHELDPRLTRGRLLTGLAGLGLVAFLPGCGGDDSSSLAPAAESTPDAAVSSGAPTAASCVLTPELTEGPYYLDLDLVRKDITDGRPGTPLRLQVEVVDVDACAPLPDAAVDIWHADAGGVYSGFDAGSGKTFMRGVQVTDENGAAEFDTIYPGWYQGRAVHIHVKVHLGATEAFTGQIFFDEAVTDAVYEAAPYDERPGRDTLNTDDGIYTQGGDRTLVVPEADRDGYVGGVTLGIRRT